MNVFSLYYTSFDYGTIGNYCTRPFECNTQIKSGIYKGIFETQEFATRYEKAEQDFKESLTDDDETITCGPFAFSFYLMTELKPNAPSLFAPNNVEYLFTYYREYYGESDIIVLNDDTEKYTNPEFLYYVYQNYHLIQHSNGFSIYRLNSDQ